MRDVFGIVVICAVVGGRGGHGQSINLYTLICTVVVGWGWVGLKRCILHEMYSTIVIGGEDCMLHEMHMTVMLAWRPEVGSRVLLSLL